MISKIFFVFFFMTFLVSCSQKKDEISLIKEVDQQAELIATYTEAMENLKKNDTYFAANKFLEAELLFPQSDWAPKSALMAAYSYYLQDYYSKSIFHLERFISTYPKDKRMPYAYYLLAMCYYENIEDEKRDLLPLLKSKNLFEQIILEYPATDFALDAKFKIDLINEYLASKEMYIGRHYMKNEKWIAAINRFKNVINNYIRSRQTSREEGDKTIQGYLLSKIPKNKVHGADYYGRLYRVVSSKPYSAGYGSAQAFTSP